MLPRETLEALFPRRPSITLTHICAMEALGVDLDKPINEANALIADWVICRPIEECECLIRQNESGSAKRLIARAKKQWAEETKKTTKEIIDRVNADLRYAFSTAVAPSTDGAKVERFGGKGLGWCLELAEWYAHEYSASVYEALSIPLVQLFALVACARQRNGNNHGAPDYYERLEIEKLKIDNLKKGVVE